MPSHQEIQAYQRAVAEEYGLREKMTFRTEVKQCFWREDASRWLMVLRNVDTDEIFYHECQILFGATGVLVEPRACDIPGASTFEGSLFHSARWNHDVSLEGKKVVVIGNGCAFIPPCARAMLTNNRYRCSDRPSYNGAERICNPDHPQPALGR